jgi:amidophosphoribosyltransferase
MCGIIGIHKQSDPVSSEIYDGLLMLQHRGQDAAGMVTFDGEHFHEKKDNGLVKDVFLSGDITELRGHMGLGHVRYPTAGSLCATEAQPFFVNAPYGIFLVHNGNLTNTTHLRKKIQQSYKRHLRTSSDSEVLLNVFADKIYRIEKEDPEINSMDAIFGAAEKTMERIKGAYAVITMIDRVGMFAFRDPFGIRPLSVGKRPTTNGRNEYCFASEDVAFSPLGFEKIRDVEPGEGVLITEEGEMISRICAPNRQWSPCIFEYVYLARPDTMIDHISVYKTQLRLGEKLAAQIQESKLEIDSVMPVPDSSRPVALELAKNLGIKYREGLVKNRYVGRTFIMPGQEIRQKSVRRKLNPIPLEFRQRNILLVDDSIVRGNTMMQIIEMCREAGAKNVYVASASPPVKYANVYGIDMPTQKELVAHNRSIKEVQEYLGADALFYQYLEDLIDAAKEKAPHIEQFEDSCFSGNYVTGDITESYLKSLEEKIPRDKYPVGKIPLISI